MIRFHTQIAGMAIGIVISSAEPAVAENVLRFMGGRRNCVDHGSACGCE